MRVLITGAAGRLGRKLAPVLEAAHELVLGDLASLDDPRGRVLDVTDLQACRNAVTGCEAVVHMAMADWCSLSLEDEQHHGARALQVHANGTCNMLRAAWEARVRRFVHVSSVSAVEALPLGQPCGPDTRPCGHSFYGLTKGFGEDLCRLFSHSFGLPVAVLRLGTVYNPAPGGAFIGNIFYPDDEPLPPDVLGSRVHAEDVCGAVALALVAAPADYAVAHVVGATAAGRWDLQTARELYGWAPAYAFDAHGRPVAVR